MLATIGETDGPVEPAEVPINKAMDGDDLWRLWQFLQKSKHFGSFEVKKDGSVVLLCHGHNVNCITTEEACEYIDWLNNQEGNYG